MTALTSLVADICRDFAPFPQIYTGVLLHLKSQVNRAVMDTALLIASARFSIAYPRVPVLQRAHTSSPRVLLSAYTPIQE
jgi:hypothetical protein